MPRLFVAIDPPPELKRDLASLCTDLRDVRPVASSNLHLTLCFIGEVDDPTADRIAEALARVSVPPFRLTLAGAGQFRRRTLWIGVESNPALLRLQASVAAELQRVGLPADPRPFQPHVKLARSARPRSFRDFLEAHRTFRAEPFEVWRFSLVESRLDPVGAVYEPRADYLLPTASPPPALSAAHAGRTGEGRAAALTLTFLGTRGETKVRSRLHRRHSALLVERGPARIMIDCGADWLGRLQKIAPTAIVLTHAHSDHARGLAAGAPCPVYATERTWNSIRRFPIRDRRVMPIGVPVAIGGVQFEALPVQHSRLAPAVGYRFGALGRTVFYVPDVAGVPVPERAFGGVDLFIGDGASPRRPMLRKSNGELIGHAPMIEELRWCRQAGVRRAIFTHCGSQIVQMDRKVLQATVQRLMGATCLEVRIASDGDKVSLQAGGGFSWSAAAPGSSRNWRAASPRRLAPVKALEGDEAH